MASFAASIATIISAIITAVGVLIALFELGFMRRDLRYSSVTTNFALELELYKAKRFLAEKRSELEKYADGKKTKPMELERLQGELSEAREDYFNVLDRLCSYILQKKLCRKDFKADYEKALKDVVSEHGDTDEFKEYYTNINKLNDKWQKHSFRGHAT